MDRETLADEFRQLVADVDARPLAPLDKDKALQTVLRRAFGRKPYWFLWRLEFTAPRWLAGESLKQYIPSGPAPDWYGLRATHVMDARSHLVGGYYEFQVASPRSDFFVEQVLSRTENRGHLLAYPNVVFAYYRRVGKSSHFREPARQLNILRVGGVVTIYRISPWTAIRARVLVFHLKPRYCLLALK
jgi:hypothetical protein